MLPLARVELAFTIASSRLQRWVALVLIRNCPFVDIFRLEIEQCKYNELSSEILMYQTVLHAQWETRKFVPGSLNVCLVVDFHSIEVFSRVQILN